MRSFHPVLTDLVLDHLYPALGVLLAPAWALGALVALRRLPQERGRAAVVALVCLVMLYGLMASVGLWRGPGSAWVSSVRGVQLRGQWLGIAAILMCAAPRAAKPSATPWRSALALPLLMGQGAAALLCGVVIAGLGLLEPGRARRQRLLLGLGGLLAAQGTAAWSLDLWIGLGQRLSADSASVVVDVSEQLWRTLGWVGVLSWALPAPPRPAPPVAHSAAALDSLESPP